MRDVEALPGHVITGVCAAGDHQGAGTPTGTQSDMSALLMPACRCRRAVERASAPGAGPLMAMAATHRVRLI